MSPSSSPPVAVTIRPPATHAELEIFFQVAAAQFARDVPAAIAAPDFRRYVQTAPDADPTHIRGAFRSDTYLGGYLIEERWLRIGAARLKTGSVGVVTTRSEFRGQGVARALMNDAFAYARERGHVFLMLHGLADFYDPFGYVDVFDATDHRLDREEALKLLPGPCRVRPATVDDAPAMRDLYDRHFGPHPGSFVRTAEQQGFLTRFAGSLAGRGYRTREGLPFEEPVVAVDPAGTIRGYLATAWGPLRAFGNEVTADDWPAVEALLQHDARRLGQLPQPPDELRWPLPPDGLVAALLGDHLTVRTESLHRPRANWMAAIVDRARLIETVQPIWEARRGSGGADLLSALAIAIDDADLVAVRTKPTEPESPVESLPRITLPARVVIPLLFGFRNARWAATQPGTDIADDLLPTVERLFPPLQPWIAPTDGS